MVSGMDALKDRVTRLENLVGDPADENISLTDRLDAVGTRLLALESSTADRFKDVLSDVLAISDSWKDKIQEIVDEQSLLKKAICGHTNSEKAPSKIKVPDPKAFAGNRSAKELENFLWDMEQYFKAAHVPEGEKVTITSMYLTGDAKLWWRTRVGDDARIEISTWDTLKKEMKEQFLPCNTSWVARDALKRLKHAGSVRDYVKEFSSLMLDIKNMSEEDKLFNFMSGLQNWAQLELRRLGVKDLPSAMAAADGLLDYKLSKEPTTETSKSKKKGKEKTGEKKSGFRKGKEGSKYKHKGDSSQTNGGKSNKGCFICDGPHRAKDCPKREKLNAMVAEDGKGESDSEGPTRVNPLQLLNAIHVDKAPTTGLMYVKVTLAGTDIAAMVDTGATHNFMSEKVVQTLGLQVTQSASRIKAVNSAAQSVQGMASKVSITVGDWTGRVNLMVVPLDDFDVILGNDFFVTAKVALMPYLGGILISDEDKPCFVAGCSKSDKGKSTKRKTETLSAIQVHNGLKKGAETYLAALVEIKPDLLVEVPDEVVEVLREFEDVMPPELPKSLPPRRATDHKIELIPGAKPPAKAPYRMSPMELTELRTQLTDLLDAGLVQPSKAPYGAPVLFQKKQDGSLRMCVDYRALNKVTIKNKYPVPLVADLFDRLCKATYFTKLDLRAGYWQVRVAEGDESKTTCVTRYGSFEFLVMPFGLTNAPATFCNLMNDVFNDYVDQFVVVYLDDIVIYSESLEDHLSHLRKVFSRLREHQLYVKKEKCEFAQREIKFLGHVICKGHVKMDNRKVHAITDWQAPSKVTELRSFLGLANYYRKFIEGYSKKAAPLTDLLKKDRPWKWDESCQAAFDKLKVAVASEPVLRLPDFELPFELHTDASDKAIGGVLVQEGHPVAFESRKLNDAEKKYSAHEKEMTAVVHCLQIWRVYLLGTKFMVLTDNVANTFFKTQKKLSPRQARWQEFLEEYDFEWRHKPGRHNQVADALSRKEIVDYVAAISNIETQLLERIRASAAIDSEYQRLVQQVKDGTVRRYWLENDLLHGKGDRLYVPSVGGLRLELLRETHDPQGAGHPGQQRMMALLSRSYCWPKMEDDVEAYVKTCLVCQLDKTERKKAAGLLQPLPIPTKPWVSVSMDFISGLPKVNGMRSVMVVVDRFSKYAVFIPAPHACPADVAADLFYKYVVKYFGLPEDIVSDRDTRFTGRFWTVLFNLMGSELKFSTANHPQTDGQTERMNALLEEYLRHYVTASQRNWVDLLDSAQFCYNLHRSSATGMSPFELATGQQPLTPHEVARTGSGGRCPAAYRFARAKQDMLDEAQDSLAKASKRMKKYADKGRRPLEFKVGDKVLLKLTPQIWKKISSKTAHRGLVPKYDGPFEILKRVGNVAYRLKLPDRLKIHPTIHVSYLKPYNEDQANLTRTQARRAPPVIRKQFDKEVEQILDHKTEGQSKKNRRTHYLVKWKGSPEADASWEKDVTLWQFEKQITDYLEALPTRTSASSGGGGLLAPST
ncbi:unnamed protein product [Camellia sinensis]